MKVQSSMIAEVEWAEISGGKGLLFVLFNSQDAYMYTDVPQGIYEKLLCATSVGEFLNIYVKGPNPEFDPIYNYEKIEWNKRDEKRKLFAAPTERVVRPSIHALIDSKCDQLRKDSQTIVDSKCDQLRKDSQTIEEDFPGQRQEYLRSAAEELAVDLADSVLLNLNTSREELDYLTAKVAERFAAKVTMAMTTVMHAKELSERFTVRGTGNVSESSGR